MNIVIIDDDEDDLEILQATINSVHPEANCIAYFNSDSGVDAMMSKEMPAPDLVFIDINMPRMSGDMCLKTLRGNPKFDSTKIVMISTSVSDAFRKHLEKSGANLVFTKPVDFKDYKKIIATCFSFGTQGVT